MSVALGGLTDKINLVRTLRTAFLTHFFLFLFLAGMSDDLCGGVRQWRKHCGVCHSGGGAAGELSDDEDKSVCGNLLSEEMFEVVKSLALSRLLHEDPPVHNYTQCSHAF